MDMQTLETMTQDTKIGSYVAFIYGLIIVIASGITFFIETKQAIKQHTVITQKVALNYGLSEPSASDLICFQGVLHYRNIGLFSGALAFSPNISCSEKELKTLQENPDEEVALTAFLFLVIGIFTTVISYLGIAKDKKQHTTL